MKRSEQRRLSNNAYLIISREPDSIQSGSAQSDSPQSDSMSANHNHHFPIQNLSRGGVRFSSKQHFDIDERVSLKLYINENLSHKASGRICYHDEDQQNSYYGVSFLDNYLHL